MKKLILSIVLLLATSVAYCQDQSLQLTIKSDKKVYEVGEDIIVEAVLKNNGSQELCLDHFFKDIDAIGHRSNFRFQVFKDKSEKEQQYINLELLKKMVVNFQRLTIKTGEEIIFKVTINKWYDMSKIGWYTVMCSYSSKGPFSMNENEWFRMWEGKSTSNTITIEVVEKN